MFSDENDVSFVHGLGFSGTRDPQYILGWVSQSHLINVWFIMFCRPIILNIYLKDNHLTFLTTALQFWRAYEYDVS